MIQRIFIGLLVPLAGLAAMGPSRDMDDLLRSSNAAFQRGDLATAATLLEQAQRLTPNPRLVAFNLATIYYHQAKAGQHAALAEAEVLYRCCLEPDDPRRAEALLGLGNCLLLRGSSGKLDALSLRAAIDRFTLCRREPGCSPQTDQAARWNQQLARLLLLQAPPPPAEAEEEPSNADNDPMKAAPPMPPGGDRQPGDTGEVVPDLTRKPDPGAKGQETDDPNRRPGPGKGTLATVPDQADAPPLGASDAAAHLEAALGRISADWLSHRRAEADPPAPACATGEGADMGCARWLALGLLLLMAAQLRADDSAEIPLVGRPAYLPFSEASARFVAGPDHDFRCPFALTSTATPTHLTARSPITYVVTLRALGPLLRPPSRIDLRLVPDFDRLFRIEDITDGKKEQRNPTSWRWRYRLTPRSSEIDEIPGFPLVFYNPDLQPLEKAFQVLYSDPITLHQTPLEIHPGPADDSALTLADGPAVLVAARPWAGPGPLLWAFSLIGPPLVSVICYLLWRRIFPDALRQATRRRSRAAWMALTRVTQAERGNPGEQAEQLTQALVGYLHQRFDLGLSEPTPEEVSMFLARHGFPDERTRQAATLLEDFAAARFAPVASGSDLAERTRRLVLDLEEASCPP